MVLVGSSLSLAPQQDFGMTALNLSPAYGPINHMASTKLGGEVPETIMTCKTSDTSQFCELEWFEWVMFWEETAPYFNDHFRLGRYLCPSLDIGPTLMAKIIKENCKVLHRSMYWALTQEEWQECKAKCSFFMASLNQILGPHTEVRDLVELGVEDTCHTIHMRMNHRMPKHSPCCMKNQT